MLALASSGCTASHSFIVRSQDKIEGATASLCGKSIVTRVTSFSATGSFTPSCPGPLIVHVRTTGTVAECTLGYIDSAESSKQFSFSVKGQDCRLTAELPS
jgi:hypothetical protein